MSEAHYNTCKRHWRQWDARACMASSDGVSFGDVYFYTRHTECAIFEMTDLSPIEHAFDKGQTKGRMTSTQQRQKTAAKNSIIKETHSLLRSTGNLRAFIIRIKTKQTAHLLTPAEGCHNKRKCSFNPCFLYIFLKLSSYTFIGTTKVKKKNWNLYSAPEPESYRLLAAISIAFSFWRIQKESAENILLSIPHTTVTWPTFLGIQL